MKTPPRMQMTSYPERWEEQKIQSRSQRLKEKLQHCHSSNTGEELSLISTTKRDTARQSHEQRDDDSSDLPRIDAFLTSEIAYKMQEKQKILKDDEFVDAATFLEKNELCKDDSLSHEIEENWEQVNSNCRPSDYFERKSRNLDHVELSSPRNVDDPMFQDDVIEEETEMCMPQQQLSPPDIGQGVVFHDRFDRASGLSGSGTGFSSKKVDCKATAKEKTATCLITPLQIILHGPGVIKEALHEIDALIDNSIRLASSPPTKKLLGIELHEYMSDLARDHERPLEFMLPLSRTTDSWGEDTSTSQVDDDTNRWLKQPLPSNRFCDEAYLSNADCVSCSDDERPGDVISSSLEDNVDFKRNHYSGAQVNAQNQFESSHSNDIDPNNVCFHYGEYDHQSRGATRSEHEDDQIQKYVGFESRTTAAPKQAVASRRLIDGPDLEKLRVAMDVAMIPRRCRRFLCSVGDVMTEQIVFTNVTKSVGRICVSVLPLSTGCQQFSVSPAVLELGPKTSSAFHLTFNARYAGAVSGIFQFRGVGIESLFHPYEVVIEASVKRDLELEAPSSSRTAQKHRQTDAMNGRVKELQVEQVAVTPTFIRFDRVRSKSGEKLFRKAKLHLVNNTAQALPFKVCAPENLSVSPAFATIPPASESSVSVLLMSQPLGQHRCREARSANSSSRAEDWLSTLTVQVGKTYLREVSVVADWRLIQMLPPFDEIARSRHHLFSQTDSFYYTKRDKRRGLYFHARAVEFGCCNVGESHEVSVYVCNGSKAPMTVFLQDLQEPFSSAFSSTTIEPRKFIEVLVTFTPKVVGKVATSLFAYSLTDKAVVTLIARGT
ncbi:unnamed protein product [Peronospora destructor]|uniref:Abnormal spindle-like microcephaly-associated protein ASH domain-containing protein n=1 Tax=Peronospora destructor TaxID=86335 RepID=A0AAV0U932_9STRA|nr:unnamed protein product [Peronospora destructor]